MSNLYGQNMKSPPARAPSSPHIWTNTDDQSSYMEKLFEEKRNLALYALGLPICNELLNQEISKVAEMIPNQGLNDFDRLQLGSPNRMHPMHMTPNVPAMSLALSSGWSPFRCQGIGGQQGSLIDHRNAPPTNLTPCITKKVLRLDVPVDIFPDFNFIGRLLGPRGNSLKRIEAMTGCRVFIRGRGSIKDPGREEYLRQRPGYVHLNEPLHVLIEAELPVTIIDAKLRQALEIIQLLLKPVGKSRDAYKRQQLRELAMLKSSEAGSSSSGGSSCDPIMTARQRQGTP